MQMGNYRKSISFWFIIANCALSIGNDTIAQELPNAGVSIVNGEIQPGFYKAAIRYGEAKGDSLYIKWSHALAADTFWVYKAGSSIEYITDAYVRTAWYNQPLRYERRMALHHLREYIFDSPLRFSNLEDLAKNNAPLFFDKKLYEYFKK
jgi:hypothetical protein